MCLDSARALYLAAKSRSDCKVQRLAELECRFRRLARGRDRVMMDDRVEELSEEELEEEGDVALAHRDIACSTTAAMAVNRPPNKDGLDEEDEGATDIRLGDLSGGSPRKMSASSLFSGWEASLEDRSSTGGSVGLTGSSETSCVISISMPVQGDDGEICQLARVWLLQGNTAYESVYRGMRQLEQLEERFLFS